VLVPHDSTSSVEARRSPGPPHKPYLVSVDAGEELDVLEWGGRDRTLLLMLGEGESAVSLMIAPVTNGYTGSRSPNVVQ
jgi:hypothetical protein